MPAERDSHDIASTGYCPLELTVLLGRSTKKQIEAGVDWLLDQGREVTRENLARLGVEVAGVHQAGGGSAANTICAAAQAGARAAFAGAVGDDAAGEAVRRDFVNHGVCADLLLTVPERFTKQSLLLTWPDRPEPQQTTRAQAPTAASPRSLERPRCRVLHLGFPSTRQITWAREQREEGGVVSASLGPAWQRGRAKERVAELLELAQVAILASDDARALAEFWGVERHRGHEGLVRGLMSRLPDCALLVMTLGREGAVAGERDRLLYVWPLDVEEVDATGAGDCFAGHLLAAWATEGPLQGPVLEAALRRASVAAGLSVPALSARGRLATRAEAEALAGRVEVTELRDPAGAFARQTEDGSPFRDAGSAS